METAKKSGYSHTLNLPKTDFPQKANLPVREPEIQRWWKERRIYEKMLARRKAQGAPPFILHDGPPYSNGDIHIGHALNKVLKDIVNKFAALRGYFTPYVPGWDNHGLPIEHRVQEELIAEGKWAPGEPMSDAVRRELRQRCRKFAEFWSWRQNEQFQRLGVFGDWEHPYFTMDYAFEAKLVEIFGELYERGYIYRGFKTVHWCYHCMTALAEAELEYHEKESPSIWVRFRLKGDEGQGTWDDEAFGGEIYALVWTTTPWTIPGNTGIMVHPEFEYALVQVGSRARDTGREAYLVAKGLLPIVAEELGWQEYRIVRNFVGEQLRGWVFTHPLYHRPSPIVTAEFVTLEQGSGLVHTAPGHGPEDYEVGVREGLPILSPVDERGRFTAEAGERLHGLFVHTEGNQAVMAWLAEVGALLKTGTIRHNYPHCWRCRNPVIFRATTQWFMSIDHDHHRQKCLEAIERVKWVPEEGKSRITAMVQNRPDWCLSRQRAWGVGIPVFYCRSCGQPVVTRKTIQSVAEWVRKEGSDAWFDRSAKELLPEGFRCPHCNGDTFTKETDVLDVWFDSGCTHRAVLETHPDLRWPADMYLEGSDQHRGWFNSSLMVAVATKGDAPYRTVLTHGFVVDEQGRAMHKSLGNVVAPEEIIRQYGADVLRLWVCASDYTQDVRLGPEILKRLADAYFRFRNTLRFALGNLFDFDPDRHAVPYEQLTELDKFLLHRLAEVVDEVTAAYEDFDYPRVFQTLQRFCAVDLSAFYFDVLKDCLYCDAADDPRRRSAQTVIFEIAKSLCVMLFPMMSHTAEEAWQHLPQWGRGRGTEGGKPESVALADWVQPPQEWRNGQLAERWRQLLRLRDEVNGALEAAKTERRVLNPLEAKVTLLTDAALADFLGSFSVPLAEVFIVSQVEVRTEGTHPHAVAAEEFPNLRIVVELAPGRKCARCWQRKESVGNDSAYPDLCARCVAVVRQRR
ncbi:Isoleucine--tRNA ligase [bacterium HR17]|uniref:Isoleucine--tRNA ligase n=1 Tax=Candidatus Fervidibacter japonicus TaxID=2035412 RepID=A0A2H5XFD8_9BACT|nr:Isoleucine--tRNA ligase [bacterium HR17]